MLQAHLQSTSPVVLRIIVGGGGRALKKKLFLALVKEWSGRLCSRDLLQCQGHTVLEERSSSTLNTKRKGGFMAKERVTVTWRWWKLRHLIRYQRCSGVEGGRFWLKQFSRSPAQIDHCKDSGGLVGKKIQRSWLRFAQERESLGVGERRSEEGHICCKYLLPKQVFSSLTLSKLVFFNFSLF